MIHIKKIIGFICIVIVIIILLCTANAATLTKEIASTKQAISENENKIIHIKNIKETLHNTAQLIRQYEDINNGFDVVLSNKWHEVHSVQTNLENENVALINKLTNLEEEASKRVFLGKFQLTAYYGGTRTSTGTKPRVNHTIAVDPKVIPYGSKVYIEGYGVFTAEDCGGAVKGNIIDIYMSDRQTCINFGRRRANVYLIKG